MTELPAPQPGEFLLYETEDGRTRVECRFMAETLWLSQAGMADLFQTSKQNIAKHLKVIFAEGELNLDSVVNRWLTTATVHSGPKAHSDPCSGYARHRLPALVIAASLRPRIEHPFRHEIGQRSTPQQRQRAIGFIA